MCRCFGVGVNSVVFGVVAQVDDKISGQLKGSEATNDFGTGSGYGVVGVVWFYVCVE